jgi:hypothetical protein
VIFLYKFKYIRLQKKNKVISKKKNGAKDLTRLYLGVSFSKDTKGTPMEEIMEIQKIKKKINLKLFLLKKVNLIKFLRVYYSI